MRESIKYKGGGGRVESLGKRDHQRSEQGELRLDGAGVEVNQKVSRDEGEKGLRGESGIVIEAGVSKSNNVEGREMVSQRNDLSSGGPRIMDEGGQGGGKERVEGQLLTVLRTHEKVMRMEIPVLAILDQNIVNFGKQTGKGAWKWKRRQIGKRVGKKLAESEGMEGDRVNISGQ